ncbi:MAG: glycosyltransferase family 2 protein [Flavobacterium sp.]
MAFFSVIIPLYNKEHFIENTIKSVLNQTFSDFEIIIINDGSTDKSEEKVKGFNDSRISYFSKENGGVSSARNMGIQKSNSDFITFLDADDYWYPHFLQEMFTAIEQFPKQKVFSAAIEIETSKKVIPAHYSIEKTNDYEVVDYFKASLKQSVLWTSCAVFHKSVFEKMGDFDLKIKSGQDVDLWIRVGLFYPVLFSWKILARYVYDAKSLSKSSATVSNGMNFTKFLEEEKRNPDLRRFIDLNRFTLAIKSKISGNKALFREYYNLIDKTDLSLKKRIILKLPVFVLKQLIIVKRILAELGLGSSVFI